MKSIILTSASHLAHAVIEDVAFERVLADASAQDIARLAQLVDDETAAAILRNEWCAEVPPKAPAPPAPAPIAVRASDPPPSADAATK